MPSRFNPTLPEHLSLPDGYEPTIADYRQAASHYRRRAEAAQRVGALASAANHENRALHFEATARALQWKRRLVKAPDQR